MMNDSSHLLDRLDRLERTNRRWRQSALGLAALTVSLVGLSFHRPADKVIEAERFVLRGSDGTEHASLGVDPQGNPLFLMQKGEKHALLTLNEPALHLRGPEGRTAFLGSDTQDRMQLSITTGALADGLRAIVHPDGSTGFFVLDKEGYERAGVSATSEGHSQISVRGPRAAIRGTFGVDDTENANLLLLDPAGGRRIGMLVSPEGTPLLSVEDERGAARANLTTEFDGSPRLELLSSQGTPTWKAP